MASKTPSPLVGEGRVRGRMHDLHPHPASPVKGEEIVFSIFQMPRGLLERSGDPAHRGRGELHFAA